MSAFSLLARRGEAFVLNTKGIWWGWCLCSIKLLGRKLRRGKYRYMRTLHTYYYIILLYIYISPCVCVCVSAILMSSSNAMEFTWVYFTLVSAVQFMEWRTIQDFCQAEQFSVKPRKPVWISHLGEEIWDRTVELNKPARVQKEIDRVILFRRKLPRWQLHCVNTNYFKTAML